MTSTKIKYPPMKGTEELLHKFYLDTPRFNNRDLELTRMFSKTTLHYILNDLDAHSEMDKLIQPLVAVAMEIGRYEQATGKSSPTLNAVLMEREQALIGYNNRQLETVGELVGGGEKDERL